MEFTYTLALTRQLGFTACSAHALVTLLAQYALGLGRPTNMPGRSQIRALRLFLSRRRTVQEVKTPRTEVRVRKLHVVGQGDFLFGYRQYGYPELACVRLASILVEQDSITLATILDYTICHQVEARLEWWIQKNDSM